MSTASISNPGAAAPMPHSAQPDATAASWFGMAALIVVSLYGVVDRQVFVLMAEPIRVGLGLSDFQLGLLNGLGVSVFAAVAGYPIGWLADRFDRRLVLACCITVWSLAVVLCGMAKDFTTLFIGSALVGAGEAGLGPVMFSLIPEWFQNSKRVLANALNAILSRLGSGLVIALCGMLSVAAEQVRPWLPATMQGLDTWRLTFFLAALPAPLFVLLVLGLPVRRRAPAQAQVGEALPAPLGGIGIVEFWKLRASNLTPLYAAMTVTVMGLVAVSVWMPVVAMRKFGATPAQVGNALGLGTFVAAALGLLFTMYGTRWLAPRVGARLHVILLALSAGSSGLALLLLPLSTSLTGLFVVYGVHVTLLMMGLLTYPTVLQDLSPPHLRARMYAIIGVLGLVFPAGVPPFIGAMSDRFKLTPDGLLLLTAGCSALLLLLGSILYFWASRGYEETLRLAAKSA